jgi:penicillin amidase
MSTTGSSQRRSEFVSFFICMLLGVVLPVGLTIFVPIVARMPRVFSFDEGIWKTSSASLERKQFADLKAPVDVAFDGDGIPHIVAQNEEDLFFAQGVLVSHFRLWQMDLTTRAGLGRISEILGARGINIDRFFTSFGFRQFVRDEAEVFMSDPKTAQAIQAFTHGVNAYIKHLSYRDLPVEYKLTGSWPELWNAERVAALLKIMTFNLAGRSNDLRLTRVLQKLGEEKTNELFPEFLPPHLEEAFIESNGKPRADLSWKFPAPATLKTFPTFLLPMEVNGSNAWAVSAEKSKTGFPVLANDTHLGLQLPAVWFEMQLISPATNVYGVTFPGAPGIVLGLNQSMAWGVTNGTTDVLDWYEIEFKTPESLEYKIDGSWRTAKVLHETIAVAGGGAVTVPVLTTDYGIVMNREGNLALVAKWSGQSSSNELKALLALSHSSDVPSCIDSLRDWHAPAQNFICADAKNIVNYHAGRIPKRTSGAGRVVAHVVDSSSLWIGEIPFEELPHEVNPSRGFVYSANERPAGPSYPYYLGWDYEEPFRAQRIRADLTDKNKLDGSDFIQMQNDILNQHAALSMRFMIRNLRTKDFSEIEKSIYASMQQWDFYERAQTFEPTVFDRWWRQLEKNLWHDIAEMDKPLFPRKARTILFFRQYELEPEKYNSWIAPFGSMDELVTAAFRQAVAELAHEHGAESSNWTWAQAQPTELPHVTKFPGFGSEILRMDGGAYSINGNRGRHGPAWKLVVELGPNMRAWSQFPGGVTGNPLDPEYEKFVEPWSRGEMRIVKFWKNAHEAETASMYIWRWSRQ